MDDAGDEQAATNDSLKEASKVSRQVELPGGLYQIVRRDVGFPTQLSKEARVYVAITCALLCHDPTPAAAVLTDGGGTQSTKATAWWRRALRRARVTA